MEDRKTRVFLTGATGVMGMAGLKELTAKPDEYRVTVLARDSRINRKKLLPYEKQGVEIIWGNLLDNESLRKGIENSDIVLHVGGMVSPKADIYPEETLKVNVGSMQKICDIVKELEGKDKEREIKVVYIGSVAQYGSKMPPNHWGSAQDKLNPAKYDAYAKSKVMAEEVLVSSQLKKWVSIRQTSILHVGLLKNASNPVAFHTPINGVLEWITPEDSGRLLERLCRKEVPEDFWGKFYNAGGGEAFRMTNLEFERKILKGMGCPKPEKVFETNWFAQDNFHGMWFRDSDYLDSILHFREADTPDEAIGRLRQSLPFYFKLAPFVPSFFIKQYMKSVASKKGLGPLSWIRDNDLKKIEAAWGSEEEYRKIPKWSEWKEPELDKKTPTE